MIKIFIPSYHRPDNIKTAKFFVKLGWNPKDLIVFVDNEAGDYEEYEKECEKLGCELVEFNMNEARARYDYIHRPSPALRSAGQARNMFQDYAKENGIEFYCVIDDDTANYQVKHHGKYQRMATFDDIHATFVAIEDMMRRRKIALFGLSQTGDVYGAHDMLLRKKVMNTSFYLLPYIYRGERGVQDDDTSLFAGVMNEGYFTGSLGDGIILQQTTSAKQKGGLTDLYHECKLLNKALVCPIQFPSAIHGEKQVKNGNRLHHRIAYRFLWAKILKNKGGRDNVAWDTYPEDVPFTNEPKRRGLESGLESGLENHE